MATGTKTAHDIAEYLTSLIAARTSDADLAERVAEIAEEIRAAAVAEAREYLGRALADMDAAEAAACGPRVQVTDEVVAGIRFAGELILDPEFDY